MSEAGPSRSSGPPKINRSAYRPVASGSVAPVDLSRVTSINKGKATGEWSNPFEQGEVMEGSVDDEKAKRRTSGASAMEGIKRDSFSPEKQHLSLPARPSDLPPADSSGGLRSTSRGSRHTTPPPHRSTSYSHSPEKRALPPKPVASASKSASRTGDGNGKSDESRRGNSRSRSPIQDRSRRTDGGSSTKEPARDLGRTEEGSSRSGRYDGSHDERRVSRGDRDSRVDSDRRDRSRSHSRNRKVSGRSNGSARDRNHERDARRDDAKDYDRSRDGDRPGAWNGSRGHGGWDDHYTDRRDRRDDRYDRYEGNGRREPNYRKNPYESHNGSSYPRATSRNDVYRNAGSSYSPTDTKSVSHADRSYHSRYDETRDHREREGERPLDRASERNGTGGRDPDRERNRDRGRESDMHRRRDRENEHHREDQRGDRERHDRVERSPSRTQRPNANSSSYDRTYQSQGSARSGGSYRPGGSSVHRSHPASSPPPKLRAASAEEGEISEGEAGEIADTNSMAVDTPPIPETPAESQGAESRYDERNTNGYPSSPIRSEVGSYTRQKLIRPTQPYRPPTPPLRPRSITPPPPPPADSSPPPPPSPPADEPPPPPIPTGPRSNQPLQNPSVSAPKEANPFLAQHAEKRAREEEEARLQREEEARSRRLAALPSRPAPQQPRAETRRTTFSRRTLGEEEAAYDRVFKGCSTMDDYETAAKIGQGTFGVVTKAKERVGGKMVALKKLVIHETQTRDGIPVTTVREIKILKALKHENIVPLLSMIVKKGHPNDLTSRGEVFMVFPYMDHDLCGLLNNSAFKITRPLAKLFMKQLLEGLTYIHACNIIHRDIKTANILVDRRGQAMIADFGLARSFTPEEDMPKHAAHEYTNMVVTRWYRAPELLLGATRYTQAVDMWSVGCILGELYHRAPIVAGGSDEEQLRRIIAHCGPLNDETWPTWRQLKGFTGKEGISWDRIPEEQNLFETARKDWTLDRLGVSLLTRLMKLDPAQRITAEDALDDIWFYTAPLPATISDGLITVNSSHEMTVQRDHAPAAYQPRQKASAAAVKPNPYAPAQSHQHHHQHQQQAPPPIAVNPYVHQPSSGMPTGMGGPPVHRPAWNQPPPQAQPNPYVQQPYHQQPPGYPPPTYGTAPPPMQPNAYLPQNGLPSHMPPPIPAHSGYSNHHLPARPDHANGTRSQAPAPPFALAGPGANNGRSGGAPPPPFALAGVGANRPPPGAGGSRYGGPGPGRGPNGAGHGDRPQRPRGDNSSGLRYD